MSSFKFDYLKGIPASMPDAAHRILIAIWNHANESGTDAWPGVSTLAAETGKSRATVLRWLKWLREYGWIVQERRGGRSGDGHTWPSVYSLAHGTVSGDEREETTPEAPYTNGDVTTHDEAVDPAGERTDPIAVPSVAGPDWKPMEHCWDCDRPIRFGTLCAVCDGKRIYESGRHAPQPVESVSF